MFLYLDYVQEVFTLAEECRMTFDDVPMMIPAPPPLCSSFDRPNKEEAVKQHSSRYNTSMTSNDDSFCH